MLKVHVRWMIARGCVLMALPASVSGEPTTQPARYAEWITPAVYGITVTEQRVTEAERPRLASTLVLERALRIEVSPPAAAGREAAPLRVRITALRVSGRVDDRPIEFDSEDENASTPLAELLSPLVGAEFTLLRSPDGAFTGLRRPRRPNEQFLPAPPLLSVQQLFREEALLQLISDAINPPLPSPAWARGTYGQAVNTAIPLVAPMEWEAAFTIRGKEEGSIVDAISIVAEGPLRCVRPLEDVGKDGMFCESLDGTRSAEFHVDAATGRVRSQNIVQKLVLALALKPPTGGDTLRMLMRQTTRTSVERVED